jgi:ribosomal protein S24E
MKNKLLNRRQMVLEVHHPNKSGVPKTALAAHLAAQYNVRVFQPFSAKTGFQQTLCSG